jgi:RNA-binding protein YlmH
MTDEKRLLELARRGAREDRPAFSRFLEPSMIPVAEKCARQAGAQVLFSGGYEGAERVVAAFAAEATVDFPIACLEIRWNKKYADPGHRDLLGAVMGLGIDREATGDITVGDGVAHLFAERDMARYIMENLTSAGRAKLNVTQKEGDVEAPEPEGVRARITFSSPRLDAILSAGYDLSRTEAQRMIAAGLVKLNHVPQLRTDATVREGDLLSARGFGRLKVEEMLGETKKGRLAARVFRYGK